jgi:hypothetical protein
MIEKKISYDINIEKPSKTKPVKQGGVLNYLGKQKTVSAPVKWRSSPKHPIAHLAYITKDEEKILVDLDLYGSLKGKPNKGPSGIMSLNGGGGGGDGGGGDGGGGDGGGSSGGDGDSGDSGDAGDSGTGQSGAQSGDNTDGNNADGTSGGPGTDGMGGPGGFGGEAAPGSEAGFGIGPGDETAAAQSVTADDVSAQAQADQEDAATAAAAQAAQSQTGVMSTIGNLARQAFNAYASISPVGIAMNAISNISRGVTAPDDFSQAQTSVQTSSFGSPGGGGGITTIPTYAPLTNVSTGDNTADSIRTRLENLLRTPTSQPVFTNQNVNPLSNYTLLDLYNLRK